MAGDPVADVVNLYANSQGTILGQNILQPLDDYLEYLNEEAPAALYGKHYFLSVAGDYTHPLSPLFYNIDYIEQVDALKERLLRLTAEYDNYRKRTAKEKEGIYTDACTDVLKEILPVADNLERAIAVDGTVEDLKKGVEMTIKGFLNSLEKLGVEEIDTNNGFDPNFHQAISVVEDANLSTNDIAQVYQKGYKRGDKVIRYSMVTVAK